MGLANRRRRTSCFCSVGCYPGTFPHDRIWVASFAPFDPWKAERTLFQFVQEFEGNECLWTAIDQPFGPVGRYELTKFVLFDGDQVVGFRWEVFATDGTGLNTWQHDELAALEPTPLVEPEGQGSCSKMRYDLDHVLWGEGFPAVLQPAYPDACDDTDNPAKVQTKPYAPF